MKKKNSAPAQKKTELIANSPTNTNGQNRAKVPAPKMKLVKKILPGFKNDKVMTKGNTGYFWQKPKERVEDYYLPPQFFTDGEKARKIVKRIFDKFGINTPIKEHPIEIFAKQYASQGDGNSMEQKREEREMLQVAARQKVKTLYEIELESRLYVGAMVGIGEAKVVF